MGNQNSSARLKEVLGEDLVKDDSETLIKYGTSINGSLVQPLCVVFPKSRTTIIDLINLANSDGFKLFPLSRGKNFGYGERQGSENEQVIVDLSHMDSIIEVNEKLAFARIEPGVSQIQMHDHLKQNDIQLQLDVTGAGLDASIVGNILERGFGHTDYGDRISRIVNITIITPMGEVLQTGFDRFENADAKNVYKHGIGPSVEGLFSQSNFGIVVEVTIELMPIPEKTEMFVFSTKNKDDLSGIVKTIRDLKLSGVVNSAVHIANKSRAVGEGENKFVGYWNLSGSITGAVSVVRSKRRVIKRAFKSNLGKYKLWFIGRSMLTIIKWINDNIRNIPVYLPLKDAYDLQTGVPTDNPLKTLLNDETLSSSDLDPQKYPVCFGWINAVCKADEESVTNLINILEEQFVKNNYEFRVTLTAVNPRTFILISNITYTKNDQEINKAETFISNCYSHLRNHGYYPYRSGSGQYHKIPTQDDPNINLIRNIKAIIDPNNIIAPNKYNI